MGSSCILEAFEKVFNNFLYFFLPLAIFHIYVLTDLKEAEFPTGSASWVVDSLIYRKYETLTVDRIEQQLREGSW